MLNEFYLIWYKIITKSKNKNYKNKYVKSFLLITKIKYYFYLNKKDIDNCKEYTLFV